MADEPDTQDAPDEPQEGQDEFDAERAKAKIAKANSEAKALRERLKEAEAKAKKLDELEQAGKSEADKLREKVSTLEAAAQEAEQRALRAEVAAEKGLTAAQAKRLIGTSREDLEADADELLSSFTPQEGERTPPPSKPREALRSGGDPDEGHDPDIRQIVESIPRGF